MTLFLNTVLMKLPVCSVNPRNSVSEWLSMIPSQAAITASSFGVSSSMLSRSSDLNRKMQLQKLRPKTISSYKTQISLQSFGLLESSSYNVTKCRICSSHADSQQRPGAASHISRMADPAALADPSHLFGGKSPLPSLSFSLFSPSLFLYFFPFLVLPFRSPPQSGPQI